MKQYFIIYTLSLIIFSSCTIEQEYNIQEDYSGDMNMKLDFSQMMAIMPDSVKDQQEALLSEETLDSINQAISGYDGIHNLQFQSAPGKIQMSLEFDDLEALQKLDDSKDSGSGDVILFKPKGKNAVEIDLSPLKDVQATMESEGTDDAAAAQMMMSFITMKVKIDFEREIKSIESELGELDAANNRLLYQFTLSEVLNGTTNWITTVKFK